MSLPDKLAGLEDGHPAYIPGIGEVTVGAIRDSLPPLELDDPLAPTLDMWGFLALHPDISACQVISGAISLDARRYPAFASMRDTKAAPSKSSGTQTDSARSAA